MLSSYIVSSSERLARRFIVPEALPLLLFFVGMTIVRLDGDFWRPEPIMDWDWLSQPMDDTEVSLLRLFGR